MKYRILLCLVIGCLSVSAQDKPLYDFSKVDVAEVDIVKLESSVDSLLTALTLDSLFQLRSYIVSKTYSPKYIAFVIGYESSTASLITLNAGLRAAGLNTVSEQFDGVPWGIASKGRRLLWSFTLAPFTKKKVSTQDVDLTIHATTLIDLNFGYDVLNKRRFQFYPQVGLAWHEVNLTAQRKTVPNTIDDIGGLIANQYSTLMEHRSLLLTYGLQADYHLVFSEAKGGIILGLRYGLTTDLVEGKFKVDSHNVPYTSSDRFKESYFSIVLKFYSRNTH